MMESMKLTSERTPSGRKSSADRASVLVRFALGSAAAIAVALVGGYFALRSVAIDEAKRETRRRCRSRGNSSSRSSATVSSRATRPRAKPSTTPSSRVC